MSGTESRIYGFITEKLKRSGIRINEAQISLNISRTTFWRIMRGRQVPTEAQQEAIIKLLKLDEFEQNEFAECVNELIYSENEIEAFGIIERIWLPYKKLKSSDETEFIVHNNQERKVVMTYGEIIGFIKDESAGGRVEITIYSCANKRLLRPIEPLLNENRKLTVNHYVRFYKDDAAENASIFQAIIPMLKYGGYRVYARQMPHKNELEWISDVIIVKTQQRYIAMCFAKERYNDCYISDAPDMYNMFISRLNAVKPLYEELAKETSDDIMIRAIQDIEAENDVAVLKVNPCYHVIQRHIWEQVASRASIENLSDMVFDMEGTHDTHRIKAVMKGLIARTEARYNNTYNYNNIHLFTKDGLRAFVETRRLSDHYPWLPPFTASEVKEILLNLLQRHLDPSDKLRIAVVDRTAITDLSVMASSGGDVYIQYFGQAAPYVNACIFKQPELAGLLMVFGEEYAPLRLSLNNEEAEEFIKSLVG